MIDKREENLAHSKKTINTGYYLFMTTQMRNYIEYLHSLQTLGNGKLLLQTVYDQECCSKDLEASLNVLKKKRLDCISQNANSS